MPDSSTSWWGCPFSSSFCSSSSGSSPSDISIPESVSSASMFSSSIADFVSASVSSMDISLSDICSLPVSLDTSAFALVSGSSSAKTVLEPAIAIHIAIDIALKLFFIIVLLLIYSTLIHFSISSYIIQYIFLIINEYILILNHAVIITYLQLQEQDYLAQGCLYNSIFLTYRLSCEYRYCGFCHHLNEAQDILLD